MRLCFDTCLNKMYLALGDDKKLISSKIVENTQTHYHSAFLISEIKNILKNNNLTVNDVDCIVTNVGPGSFTGIRACITVAKIYAQFLNKKVIPVSSLEILSRLSDKQCVEVIIDARKNCYYYAKFIDKKAVIEPKVLPVDEYQMSNCDIISEKTLVEKGLDAIAYEDLNADLGKILYEVSLTKTPTTWENLEPLYLQPPPVSLKK